MSAINPRASGLWASSRMSYISVANSYDEEAGSDVDLEAMDFDVQEDDGRTPLDRTIDRIGMGEQPFCRPDARVAEISLRLGFRELPVDASLPLWLR